jgi:hypothetical protein
MATKKDFSNINTGRVFGAVEQATHDTGKNPKASPAEVKARKEAMQTQGRKGCKATRINLAIKPSNHEFVKILASATGKSMTEIINTLIEAYRMEHPEMMEQARGFLDTINSGAFSKLMHTDDDEEDGGTE